MTTQTSKQKPRWKKRADFTILNADRDFIVDKINEYRMRHLQVQYILSKMQYSKPELLAFLKKNELKNWSLTVDDKDTRKLVTNTYIDTLKDNEELILQTFTHPRDTQSRYKDGTLSIKRLKGDTFVVCNRDAGEKFRKYVENTMYPNNLNEYVHSTFVKDKEKIDAHHPEFIQVVNSLRYSAKMKVHEGPNKLDAWCYEMKDLPTLDLLREYIKLNQEFKPSKRWFKQKAA